MEDNVKNKDIDEVIKLVCDYYFIHEDLLKTQTRKREVVDARHIIWAIVKELYPNRYTLAYLGDYVAKRDHATVLHGTKAVNDRRETNANFNNLYISFRDALQKTKVEIKRDKQIEEIREHVDKIKSLCNEILQDVI